MQFLDVKHLADVLPNFAKKLVVLLNINELHQSLISTIQNLFTQNKGESPVSFEIVETQKIAIQNLESLASLQQIEEVEEPSELASIVEEAEVDVYENTLEEVKVNTITLSSKKVKININKELLFELEKEKIKFQLN